jgi:acyl-CoA thioesterase YciA
MDNVKHHLLRKFSRNNKKMPIFTSNDDQQDSISTNIEDQEPAPNGELILRLIPGRQESNIHGGISGGWVAARMDEAAESVASKIADGRVANVSMDSMVFMSPIRVGTAVCVYTKLEDIGKSSIKINVEVWTRTLSEQERRKVVDATFVYVAVDEHGRIRNVPR